MRLFLSFIAFSFMLISCSDDTPSPESEDEIIMQYLEDNNLTAERTEEGVYYIVNIPGSAEKPNSNSQVTMEYRGYLIDGTEFDSNDNFVTQLWQVIDGWTIGVPQFGRGGAGTLIIPSRLGYGSQSVGSIPANSILLFDIVLIDFQ